MHGVVSFQDRGLAIAAYERYHTVKQYDVILFEKQKH
jgi:hypothetical protein